MQKMPSSAMVNASFPTVDLIANGKPVLDHKPHHAAILVFDDLATELALDKAHRQHASRRFARRVAVYCDNVAHI